MYVSSFCKDVFGDNTPLERCRANLKAGCNVDVLSWFDVSPAESEETLKTVQTCLTEIYHQKPDFLNSFNTKIKIKELRDKNISPAPKKKQRLFLLGSVLSFLVILGLIGIRVYKIIRAQMKENELNDRLKAIDGRVVSLSPDNFMDNPDVFTNVTEMSNEEEDIGEECLIDITIIISLARPILELFDVFEEVKEATYNDDEVSNILPEDDDIEFVTADAIDDISEDLWKWAILVDQVHLGDKMKASLNQKNLLRCSP